MPEWLRDGGESGIGAHKFAAKDLPTWSFDDEEWEAARRMNDSAWWPHLGNIKLGKQRHDLQYDGVHQLHVFVSARNRKAGKPARERQMQRRKDKWQQECGSGGWAQSSSAVADSPWGQQWPRSR